jgi:hypothetical protein
MESAKLYPLSRNRFAHSAVVNPPAIPPKPKLLDEVRQAIRRRHYSDRTEKAYVHWIKRYIFFHNKRHPQEMAEAEIARFLSSLATAGRISASTQNQAFNALLFLYDAVLNKKIGLIDGVVRAKRPQRLPVVLTKDEVKKVIDHINKRRPAFDGDFALWGWLAIDGMLPASSQGYRFFAQRDCCSFRQRKQRSPHHVAKRGSGVIDSTSSRRQVAARR